MFESITSLQNDRIKNLVRLRDGGHRRRQGRFIIEGLREVARAIAAGFPVETLYFCDDLFRDEAAFTLLEDADNSGLEVVQLGAEAFNKVAFRQNPDGILASASVQNRDLNTFKPPQNCLLVILESAEKPGNIGAVMRSINAAGGDALILANTVSDPYNPQTIRSSQGAFFDLPFFQCSSEEAIAFLESNQIQSIITSPNGKEDFWSVDFCKASALVLGSEDRGLSDVWLDQERTFRLNMQGITDSLNLSAMAAVGLFEAVRQRSAQDF